MEAIKLVLAGSIGLIIFLLYGCQEEDLSSPRQNIHYLSNREPLIAKPYTELPLGSIKPTGWLYEQLRLAKDGMTGHLDEIYPEVVGSRNGWLGGDGDGWERGPYWIDGLVPLAYILQDQYLIGKSKSWIEWSLQSQTPEGYFGPVPFEKEPDPEPGLQKGMREDWWPHMVMLKVLQSYYSATNDQRVIDLMTRYFRYQLKILPLKHLDHWTNWARNRGGENLSSIYWLYNITGEKFLLDLARFVFQQTDPWAEWFSSRNLITRSISLGETEWSSIHGVNMAMALKQPIIYYQQAKDVKYLQAVKQAFADLKEFHGQVQGLFSNDELLHGTNPTQGTELCTIVELMFSLEQILQITGDLAYADLLERVAYNAFPTQVKDDFMGRQYFQQPNQILVNRQNRNFITPHKGTDLCFGILTGYPCCTTNMHQGWPKYVQNLWYATPDNGLAALIYAPSNVTAKVVDGIEISFEEQTEYPFNEKIKMIFTGKQPVKFPLHLRIPAWCSQAVISINGKQFSTPRGDQVVAMEREWQPADVVELNFPMQIQKSRWHENSVGIERGPLVYVLRIEERWQKKNDQDQYQDYEEVIPASAWNYALLAADLENPDSAMTVQQTDQVELQPWNLAHTPIRISVKARKLPQWQEYNGMAGALPYSYSYLESVEPIEEITLIPYGCSTLRIAEFPVVK